MRIPHNADNNFQFFSQSTKDGDFFILQKDANVSKFYKEELETLFLTLPNYQSNIARKTFEFCSKYRCDPFKHITHPIDSVSLPNYYNDFLDHLDNGTLVQILSLADFLQIDPLLQLICYKISYWLRDMSSLESLQFFQKTMPEDEFVADL